MITTFPPGIEVEEQRAIKHYTRTVEVEGLFPGPRWIRHVEALHASPLCLTKTGKPDNSTRGHCVNVSLWDALATRIAPGRLEWKAELSQRTKTGEVDLSKPYLKAEADIFCHRTNRLGRDFMISACGALRERGEITDRRGRIAKDILVPEPCVVLIVYSEHADIREDRRKLTQGTANGRRVRTRARAVPVVEYCVWIDELIYAAQVEKINQLIHLISEQ